MVTTITQFRKEMFQLAEDALNGEPVAFTWRGVTFNVIPDSRGSKLDKLVGQRVVAPESDLEHAGRELAAEMEAECSKDWSEL